MSSKSFKFKQFEVQHDKCAMKVGTDGVLLGAWVAAQLRNTQPKMILDIGTGSGLIALMLAQAFKKSNIIGIEIDQQAAQQAADNFEKSPWNDRLKCIHADINTHNQAQYDLIVSNPPYFQNSLKNPQQEKATARHTGNLSYQQLTSIAADMLEDDGRLAIIIPFDSEKQFVDIAERNLLFLNKAMRVRGNENKDFKRSLMIFSRHKTDNISFDEITLETTDHQRTEKYQILTQDYYL